MTWSVGRRPLVMTTRTRRYPIASSEGSIACAIRLVSTKNPTPPNLQYPPGSMTAERGKGWQLPKASARRPKQKVGHRPTRDPVREADPMDAHNIVKRAAPARVLHVGGNSARG